MTNAPRIAYGAIGWLLWPMGRIASELKLLGVSGIEGFGLTDLLPDDDDLAEHLNNLGTTFVGAYYGASLVQPEAHAQEMAEFEQTVREIARLGGDVVAVGGGRHFDGKEKEHWPLLIAGVREMGRIAAQHGVKLAYHPHQGTLVFEKPEVERFVEDTKNESPQVGLTFDTAHFHCGGMDIREWMVRLRSRVVHVHLKDVNEKGEFVELGKGKLDLEGFLRELLTGGYQGWLTIELDASLDPVASARTSVTHLNALLDRIRQ